MIVLKILATPFVVALTLIVAIVSFLYCVASALCHVGCVVLTLLALVLFIAGQVLGGVVFLVLAFLVSPFGIPAIADWLMDRLCCLMTGQGNERGVPNTLGRRQTYELQP